MGGNLEFDTSGAAEYPLGVETIGATDITDSSATLEGNLTGLGGHDSVKVRFYYWVKGKKSSTMTGAGGQTLSERTTFNTTVTDLRSNETYVFHARVDAPDGETEWGDNLEFETK